MERAFGLVEAPAAGQHQVGPHQQRALLVPESRWRASEGAQLVHAVVHGRDRPQVRGEVERHGRVVPRHEVGDVVGRQKEVQQCLQVHGAGVTREVRDRDRDARWVAPGLQRRARRIVMRLLNKQHASGLGGTAQQVLRTLVDEVPSQVTETDQVEFRHSCVFTTRTDGQLQVPIRRVLVQHDPLRLCPNVRACRCLPTAQCHVDAPVSYWECRSQGPRESPNVRAGWRRASKHVRRANAAGSSRVAVLNEKPLQFPCVVQRRASRGVIEDTPHVDRFGHPPNKHREPREVARVVPRPVHPGGTVQTKVGDAIPSAGSVCAIGDRGIGDHSGNRIALHHGMRTRREPGGMPRLADHRPVVVCPDHVEESRRDARLKRERRWKLDQQRAALITQAAALSEKLLEWRARTEKLEFVRAEALSRQTGTHLVSMPPISCRSTRRAVDEGGIDLRARKHPSVALEVCPFSGAEVCRRPWDRPARRPDVDPSRHHSVADHT